MAARTAPSAGARTVFAMTLALAALAWSAAAEGGDAAASDKAASGGKRAGATHAWRDGNVQRTLALESGLRADFSGALSGKSMALRPSVGALKDVSPSLQSPVFRDEGGRLRALPGGVVVMMRDVLEEPAARALLAAHDARLTRRLGERAWLVESAAGLASLELANRLADSGAFAAAQPNWWVERALK